MPTAVITVTDSGIRNALARILVKKVNTDYKILSPDRHTQQSQGYDVIAADIQIGAPIAELSCETSGLDVSLQNDIEAFKTKIGDRPIDLLMDVAGVIFPHDSDALDKITLTNLQRTFAVNTFGPLLLTQALTPNVDSTQRPRTAVVSPRVESIADKSTGGMYSYRFSKTAVNMLFKNLAVDLKDRNTLVVLLHPGIVKTNLDQKWKDGGNEDVKGAIESGVAASDLWRVLMSKGLESTGKFFHRSGKELPW